MKATRRALITTETPDPTSANALDTQGRPHIRYCNDNDLRSAAVIRALRKER